jgi:hypothetical protein
MISSSAAVDTVRESLNKAVDSFVDDYRAVNPARGNTQLEKPDPQN